MIRSSDYDHLFDALMATENLEYYANLCTDSFGTDILGTNALIACGAIHYGHFVALMFHTTRELLDDAITGSRVDNVAVCVEQLGSQFDKMDAKLDEILILLNTPQGLRPQFSINKRMGLYRIK